jgi:hypothetical protein
LTTFRCSKFQNSIIVWLTCHFQFYQKDLKECDKETEGETQGETVVPAEASNDRGKDAGEEKKSKAQHLSRY